MSDKVTIYKEKLATVLAYLAAHMPEGKRDHDEWFRCVQILAAQREEPEAQIDDAAGTCGDCELRGNCDEDTLPGGCPKYVAKKWKGVKAAPQESLCLSCADRHVRCALVPDYMRSCYMYIPDAEQTLTTNATPPPQYGPATVAFPAYVTRDELAKGLLESRWHQANRLQDQIDEAMKAHLGEKHGITITDISCRTCHHHAVCGKMNNTGCESWEGEHPR
jgi:hypothetical protein